MNVLRCRKALKHIPIFDAPLKNTRLDGDRLVFMAESVKDTVDRLYVKSRDKRALDTRGISDGDLDKELVYLVTQYVPEALEDLGGYYQ